MRLIAWNANYNNRRRSLEETAALFDSFCPDILVLSETAKPHPDNPLQAHWFGENNPGLAVIVRDGFCLERFFPDVAAPTITAGFRVSGEANFNLIAAWPVQHPNGPTYHGVLMASLKHYEDLLRSGPCIIAGDLNSNTRVISQKLTHPLFVEKLRHLGLVSAYHFQTQESHGKESVPTYIHGSGIGKAFHLDYCFISGALAEESKITILCDGEWAKHSDHFPLLLDVPDILLRC